MILGVHDGHDAGAVLIDGERIFAVNEERLNRIKKYRGFPELSIRKVLEMARASPPEDVEIIAVAGIFRKQKRLIELEENLKAIFGQILSGRSSSSSTTLPIPPRPTTPQAGGMR